MNVKFDLDLLNPGAVAKSLLAGFLFLIMYFSAFQWLLIKDWARDDYNYGYLIPFVVLYMMWEKRHEFIPLKSVPNWTGMVLLLPGFILYWLGELAGEFFSVYISFWLILCGLLWLILGWRKLRIIAFPLIILLSAFPLPNFLNVKLTFQLKLISSWLGVKLLQIYGLSAYREGNIIDLGFTQLQVVDACSGLRYLFPLIVLGLILSHYYRAALWKKIVLVLSTIPLSIVTNSFRIALTGILYQYWGPKVAEDFFHGFSGWIIFLLSLGVLLCEMWILRRLFPDDNIKQTEIVSERGNITPSQSFEIRTLFKPSQFLTVIVFLVITISITFIVDFREKIIIKKPFSQFPPQIGEWIGSTEAMDQELLKELDLSDYIIADYRNKMNQEINFYTAYYQSQRKGESIHSPDTCLPASGWIFTEAGASVIKLKNGTQLQIKRAFMEKSGARELSYYWFPMRGRNLTSPYQMKIYTFWDALTKQRTDGALVRLITPVYPNEKLEDAEFRLQAFTKEIVPVLDEYLPGKE